MDLAGNIVVLMRQWPSASIEMRGGLTRIVGINLGHMSFKRVMGHRPWHPFLALTLHSGFDSTDRPVGTVSIFTHVSEGETTNEATMATYQMEMDLLIVDQM